MNIYLASFSLAPAAAAAAAGVPINPDATDDAQQAAKSSLQRPARMQILRTSLAKCIAVASAGARRRRRYQGIACRLLRNGSAYYSASRFRSGGVHAKFERGSRGRSRSRCRGGTGRINYGNLIENMILWQHMLLGLVLVFDH